MLICREAAPLQGLRRWRRSRIVVQGFGNVGSIAARACATSAGAKIIAGLRHHGRHPRAERASTCRPS